MTWICNGCVVAGGGTGFGIILFLLSMVIATTIIAVMLLYVGLGDHRHGPFAFVEDRDLHEPTYRCVTCGEIVTAAEGYYPLSSMR